MALLNFPAPVDLGKALVFYTGGGILRAAMKVKSSLPPQLPHVSYYVSLSRKRVSWIQSGWGLHGSKPTDIREVERRFVSGLSWGVLLQNLRKRLSLEAAYISTSPGTAILFERKIFPDSAQILLVSHPSPQNRGVTPAVGTTQTPQLSRLTGRNVFLPCFRGAGFRFPSHPCEQRKWGERSISPSLKKQPIVSESIGNCGCCGRCN